MEKHSIKREPSVHGLVVGKDWVESDRILHQRFVEPSWQLLRVKYAAGMPLSGDSH